MKIPKNIEQKLISAFGNQDLESKLIELIEKATKHKRKVYRKCFSQNIIVVLHMIYGIGQESKSVESVVEHFKLHIEYVIKIKKRAELILCRMLDVINSTPVGTPKSWSELTKQYVLTGEGIRALNCIIREHKIERNLDALLALSENEVLRTEGVGPKFIEQMKSLGLMFKPSMPAASWYADLLPEPFHELLELLSARGSHKLMLVVHEYHLDTIAALRALRISQVLRVRNVGRQFIVEMKSLGCSFLDD